MSDESMPEIPLAPAGPLIRTDVLDVYIFRRVGTHQEVEILQLLRASEPLFETWQPVMGHIEPGETATEGMWRELGEETGLTIASARLFGAWALEGVHPYLIVRLDTIFMSPRFAVEVDPEWTPVLCAGHSEWRWVALAEIDEHFMWPGQLASIRELVGRVLVPGSLCEPLQRLWLRPDAVSLRRT